MRANKTSDIRTTTLREMKRQVKEFKRSTKQVTSIKGFKEMWLGFGLPKQNKWRHITRDQLSRLLAGI